MTTNARTAELRLALVCYGGVSLAIYMHGVTKELHKLVKAGRRFDELSDLDGPNPFGATETESAYFEALRRIAKETGRRLSVSIDIIAGASAGGINGVVLAKAIALNAEQEKLRELWIDEGDLKKLLRGPSFGGLYLRGAVAAVKQLFSLGDRTSPLRGERMSELLVGALDDMDTGAAGRSPDTLIPHGGELCLYVTATDLYGFSVLVPSGVGGASQRDRSHQQVLEFSATRERTAGFGPERNTALAFSARATSSFPGAFAPVSVGSFGVETSRRWTAPEDLFRYRYDENRLRTEDAWFVDGGTLNNRPFDLVVDAVAKRPARTEVLRRIVYIQPDPGQPLGKAPRTPDPDAPPRQVDGYVRSVWKVLGGVRNSHPVLPDLLEIRDLNWRIDQVGAIAGREMADVLSQLDKAMKDAGLMSLDQVTTEQLQTMSDEMHTKAIAGTGPAYGTYQRLKVESVVRRLVEEVCDRYHYPPDSARSAFARAAISAWARQHQTWLDGDAAALNAALLGPADLPYRERRMLFLLAGVNAMYADGSGPDRGTLDRLKAKAWTVLDDLREAATSVVAGLNEADLRFLSKEELDRDLLTDPDAFARQHASAFGALFESFRDGLAGATSDGSATLWEVFRDGTGSWSDEQRCALLGRYLGFPMWDALIFPTISLSQLPQFTPMPVTQYSPLTARALEPDGVTKLKGVALRHFGAFVETAWRENDYLWGRLDGAELVLSTLYSTGATPVAGAADGGAGKDAIRRTALEAAGGRSLVDALRAVLDSEAGLSHVGEERSRVRGLLGDLEKWVTAPGSAGR